MTVPILCLVVAVQVGWVFLLKLQVEELRREAVVRDGSGASGTAGYQKGTRSFRIGRG